MNREKTVLHIGIDIGSTTTKIAALDTRLNRVVTPTISVTTPTR